MSTPRHVCVMTTCPNAEEAGRLADALVQQRLAACVQTHAVDSTYRWQGVVEHSAEVRLLIKARLADLAAIDALVKATVSYENPELVALPVVAGSRFYLDWIDAQTQR